MDLRRITSDLIEDAFGMWRFRWVALAVAWTLALVGWAWVLLLPNQYVANARVFVDTKTMLKPLMRGLTVDSDTMTDANVVTQALLTRPQLKTVALETGLDARATTPEELEMLLMRLNRTVRIEKMPKQDIFSISYRDSDPVMARNVVQVLLTTFMQNSLNKDRTNSIQAQKFLVEQIKLYEQRLEEAESRLADFKKQNVGLMPGEGGGYFARLSAAEAALKQTQADISSLQGRRAELMRQISGGEAAAGSPALTDRPTSVDKAIMDQERLLADLQVQFTDRHPDVIRARQTIEELKKTREAELARASAGPVTNALDPVAQQVRLSLNATEVELASLRSQLSQRQETVAALRRSVDTIPEVEAQLNRLNRDYDIVKSQYDALVERLESARLSEEVQADKEQVTFDVIEPPRLPLFPVAPKRSLLYSAVLAAALLAGLAVAFLLNHHSPVFFSSRKLRDVTGLPIFGNVSLARPRPMRRRDLMFAGLAAGLVVAFVALLFVGAAGVPVA